MGLKLIDVEYCIKNAPLEFPTGRLQCSYLGLFLLQQIPDFLQK